MSHRVNVVLDDQAWRLLHAVPRGERSRFVSRAVVEVARLARRRQGVEQLERLRLTIVKPPGSAEEWIRADRDGR